MNTNPLAFKERIQKRNYRYLALSPKNSRVKQIIPDAPLNAQWDSDGETLTLNWEPGRNNASYVVYKCRKGKQPALDDVRSIVEVTGLTTLEIKIDKHMNPLKYSFIVTALSLTNHESSGVVFE